MRSLEYLLDGRGPEDGAVGAFEKVVGGAGKVVHYEAERVARVHVFLSGPEQIEESLQLTLVQRDPGGLAQGFVDLDLGSSPSWWAATVVTYCPSRMVEHPKSKSTKPRS